MLFGQLRLQSKISNQDEKFNFTLGPFYMQENITHIHKYHIILARGWG